MRAQSLELMSAEHEGVTEALANAQELLMERFLPVAGSDVMCLHGNIIAVLATSAGTSTAAQLPENSNYKAVDASIWAPAPYIDRAPGTHVARYTLTDHRIDLGADPSSIEHIRTTYSLRSVPSPAGVGKVLLAAAKSVRRSGFEHRDGAVADHTKRNPRYLRSPDELTRFLAQALDAMSLDSD